MLHAQDFRRGCQAARTRLLQDQQQSMNSFLETLASLCEKESDPLEIAKAIREDWQPLALPSLSVPSSRLAPETKDRDQSLETSVLKSEVKYRIQNSMLPPGEVLDDSKDTPPVSDSDDVNEEKYGIDSVRESHERASRHFLNQELDVHMLDFMDENGNILGRTSSFEHVFGKKARVRKEKFFQNLCRCKPRTGKLAGFVNSQAFKLLSASVICLNFLFIISQSDYRMANLNSTDPELMVIGGHCFTAFYTIEICFVMVVDGRDFWLGPELGWNIFDFGIVLVAWLEIAIKTLGVKTVSTSFLRILRFFKISRVLRMFTAVRMFKEIRIMVDSLCGCFSIFVFCTLILSIFLSIFAIFFVQGATSYIESEAASPAVADKLRDQFGSVAVGMLSLFKCASGGDDWTVFHDTVAELGPMYNLLFIIFIGSYVLAFFNVITATFCEKAISLAAPTRNELVHRRLEKEYADAKELTNLKARILPMTKDLSREEFDMFIRHPEVEVYFEVRGLKALSAHKFFKTLCEVYKTDKINFATFVSACVRLDGQGSTIDMHCSSVRATHYYRLLARQIQKDRDNNKMVTRSIQAQLAHVTSYMEAKRTRSSTREKINDTVTMFDDNVADTVCCRTSMLPVKSARKKDGSKTFEL